MKDRMIQKLMEKRKLAMGGQVDETEAMEDFDDKLSSDMEPDDAEEALYADGGPVLINPEKAKEVSEGFKHVFAEGGEVDDLKEDTKSKRRKLMASVLKG